MGAAAGDYSEIHKVHLETAHKRKVGPDPSWSSDQCDRIMWKDELEC